MQIEQLDKQRAKFYKDYLQQQINKHSELKRYESSYMNRKNNIDNNQLIKLLNDHDQQRLKLRKNNAIMLKQHNRGVNQMKNKSKSGAEDIFQNQRKHNSFTDDISNMDEFRIHRIKNELAEQNVENFQQDQMRKFYKQHEKNIQRSEQEAHLRRNKLIQELSVKNYEENKRRHQQNMNLFNLHQSLIEQNQQVKKDQEKFTQSQQDVINPLYRNESQQRRKGNIYNQSIIKQQMDQFKRRKSMQMQGLKSKEGSELEKSIFRNILHHDSYNRKQYADFLKTQIDREHSRKSYEKTEIKKQKADIRGVLGGQYDPERQYQIQIVEQGIGFRNYDAGKYKHKNFPEAKTQYSHMKNTSNSSPKQQTQYQHQNRQPQTYKNIETSNPQDYKMEYNPEMKAKSTTYQTSHTNIKPPSSTRQPVKHSDQYNKRYFKSYDLVTGRSKIYDYEV